MIKSKREWWKIKGMRKYYENWNFEGIAGNFKNENDFTCNPYKLHQKYTFSAHFQFVPNYCAVL